MTRQLTKFRNIYSLHGIIHCKDQANSIWDISVATLWGHAIRLTGSLPAQPPLPVFSHNAQGRKTAIVFIRELQLLALQINISEMHEDCSCYDFCIRRKQGFIDFSMRVSVGSSFMDEQNFTPSIALELAAAVGLSHGRQLSRKPLLIFSANDIEKALHLICMPDRDMPVVVISELRDDEYSGNAKFLLDAGVIADKLKGYAHVIQFSYVAAREWTNRIGIQWAVFDGAVRVFSGRLNMETSPPGNHPYFLKDKIQQWQDEQSQGISAFSRYLISKVKVLASLQNHFPSGTFFFHQALQLQKELNLCNKEYQKQLEDLSFELECQKEELQYYQKQLDEMQLSFSGKRDKPELPCTLPLSYSEIAAWVRTELKDKLELHPRAERALHKAEFHSFELVVQALLLLANDYRDNRMGIMTESQFKEKCRTLELDLQGTLGRSQSGGKKENYFVTYPVGSGKQQLLQFQLKKGVSRQKKYCLRIYFFWDTESRKVIVGYLPDHLPSHLT